MVEMGGVDLNCDSGLGLAPIFMQMQKPTHKGRVFVFGGDGGS